MLIFNSPDIVRVDFAQRARADPPVGIFLPHLSQMYRVVPDVTRCPIRTRIQ